MRGDAKSRIEESSIPEPMSGCWIWLGTTRTNSCGMRYGELRLDGKKRMGAHRYSYEAYKGPIPAGLCVCHSCDMPMCVNPDHLFLGTNQDNVDDRQRKGRNKIVSGQRHGQSRITNDQAAEVKRLLAHGVLHRIISDRVGVALTTIEDISLGRSWKNVAPAPEDKIDTEYYLYSPSRKMKALVASGSAGEVASRLGEREGRDFISWAIKNRIRDIVLVNEHQLPDQD